MLTPSDPAAKVIVNQTNKKVHKKLRRGQPTYEIAPGKGKVSSFYLFSSSLLLQNMKFQFSYILLFCFSDTKGLGKKT